MYVDRKYFFSKADKKVKIIENNAKLPSPLRYIDATGAKYIGPSIIIISYVRMPA